MIPAFAPFLALRYLLTRPIMVLGIAGVAFAVWAMLLVDAVFSGFVAEIHRDVQNSTSPLLVTDLPHDTGYERLQKALEADPDVGEGHTAPRLRHYGILQGRRDSRQRIASSEVDWDHMAGGFALLLGIDPERERRVTALTDWLPAANDKYRARHEPPMPEPRVLQESDPARLQRLLLPDSTEYAARRRAGLPRPDSLADFHSEWPGVLFSWRRRYYLPWLQYGDPIDLLSAGFPTTQSADQGLRPTKVRLAFAGFFRTGHRLFDEATAMVPIETLRTQLGHDLDDPGSIDLVTDIAVLPKSGLSDAALQRCQARLQAAVQALLPAGSKPCSVLDWRQQNGVFLSAVAHEHKLMQFVLFVVMLVAAFVIYAVLHMMVVQKVRDIGVLAAIGGAPFGIGLVFLCCGLVVGFCGITLGTIAGVLSARWLNPVNDWLTAHFGVELFPRQVFDLDAVPCHLTHEWIAAVAGGALLLCLLVALVPARAAARWHPVAALAHE